MAGNGNSGRHATEMIGVRFGSKVVTSRGATLPGGVMWNTVCDCGVRQAIRGNHLRNGVGNRCVHIEKHGKSGTLSYSRWRAARSRAVALGVPFSIEIEDIVIPATCPILGIPLDSKSRDRQPSLDRIVPALGYVPGNVAVISARANTLKNNLTLDELRRIVRYVESFDAKIAA